MEPESPLDGGDPAGVGDPGGELGEPRERAVHEPVDDPPGGLDRRVDRVLPPEVVRLRPHRGDEPDRLARVQRPHPLGVPARRPEGLAVAARLVIHQEERHRPRDPRLQVGGRERAQVGHEPHGRRHVLDGLVPVRHELAEPGPAPGAVGRPGLAVGGIRRGRQRAPRRRPEVRRRRPGVPGPVPLPPVGEQRVDVVVPRDLAEHLGGELPAVPAERVGEVDAGHGPVLQELAVLGPRDPLGPLLDDVSVHRVRVHPGHHGHPARAGQVDDLAEQVPVAQVGAAMVHRHLGRVVRDVAARADADRGGRRPLDDVGPLVEVEVQRVVLHEGELGPAVGAVQSGARSSHLIPVVAMPLMM